MWVEDDGLCLQDRTGQAQLLLACSWVVVPLLARKVHDMAGGLACWASDVKYHAHRKVGTTVAGLPRTFNQCKL